MKIGILGGSFNPVHIGHLRLAIECLETFALDKVWLMPAYLAPHKAKEKVLPYSLRVKMLELCVQDLQHIEVSTVEGDLGGISYTVRTLSYLSKEYTLDDFYFILGDKDFLSLPSWHKAKSLLDFTNLIVVRRYNLPYAELDNFAFSFLKVEDREKNKWIKGNRRIYVLDSLNINISSSLIRNKFLAKKNLNFLIPEKVNLFLEKHRETIEKIWL